MKVVDIIKRLSRFNLFRSGSVWVTSLVSLLYFLGQVIVNFFIVCYVNRF